MCSFTEGSWVCSFSLDKKMVSVCLDTFRYQWSPNKTPTQSILFLDTSILLWSKQEGLVKDCLGAGEDEY